MGVWRQSSRGGYLAVIVWAASLGARAGEQKGAKGWKGISKYFSAPKEYAEQYGAYRSPLVFEDGTVVKTAEDWQRRRKEILRYWHREMGEWPAAIEKPKIEILESGRRENFTQQKVRLEIAP